MAKRKDNAFTIVELLVAMGLLVMLVALSSAVFSTTVKAHRKATASIEVTRTLRVLTDQLSSDLRGLRKDTPLIVWFEVDSTTGRRYDQIFFFADGDFQTMNAPTVYGNMARIYYGHANSPDGNDYKTRRILSRRTHLLTSDTSLSAWPDYDPATAFADFQTSFTPAANNAGEYDTLTLTQWKNILDFGGDPDPLFSDPVNAEHLIENTMLEDTGDHTLSGRPVIDVSNSAMGNYHLLMAQGVLDFSVQFSRFDSTTQQWFWYPCDDPDGDGNDSDSEFPANKGFGYYMNMPESVNVNMDSSAGNDWTRITELPKALKFTFTLRDVNGLFEDGKTFTHIVYLD